MDNRSEGLWQCQPWCKAVATVEGAPPVTPGSSDCDFVRVGQRGMRDIDCRRWRGRRCRLYRMLDSAVLVASDRRCRHRQWSLGYGQHHGWRQYEGQGQKDTRRTRKEGQLDVTAAVEPANGGGGGGDGYSGDRGREAWSIAPISRLCVSSVCVAVAIVLALSLLLSTRGVVAQSCFLDEAGSIAGVVQEAHGFAPARGGGRAFAGRLLEGEGWWGVP